MQTRWITLAAAAFVALLLTQSAPAQDAKPPMSPMPIVPALPAGTAPSPVIPAMPADGPPMHIIPAMPAGEASAPASSGQENNPAPPFTPLMLGDFIGPVANLFADFKIAEGESPRPMDRVFFKYNFYNNVDPTRWADPTQPVHNVNLNLYTFGIEKTFFDGLMSLGVRIPFYNLDAEGKDFHIGPDPTTGAITALAGGPGIDENDFGNIILIAKALLWEDRQAGSLLSAGVVASIPTASDQKLDPGLSTLMYMQPFTGFILTSGDLYFQGFSSITLPVARPESIVSFTDLGVGYYVWRDPTCSRLLSAVAPTLEMHYTAPIRQVDGSATLFGDFIDNLRIHNTIDFTLGSTFEFRNHTTLGVGLAVPVTGERPFDVEMLVQLNMMF